MRSPAHFRLAAALLALLLPASAAAADPQEERLDPIPAAGCIGPLEKLFEGDQPRLCPAGDLVVFVRGTGRNHDVHVRNLATGKETQLTAGKGDDLYPDFFPDCTRVLFSSDRGGSFDLWTVDVEDKPGEPVQLTSLEGDELRPRVGPIPFELEGIHPYMCGGPSERQLATYHKILFVHVTAAGSDVRFTSDNGLVGGILQPGCEEAAWTADGLGMALRCKDELVVARIDQLDLQGAIQGRTGEIDAALGQITGGRWYDYVEPDQGDDQAMMLLRDPRRIKVFVRLDDPMWRTRAEGALDIAPSANHLALVAAVTGDDRKGLAAAGIVGPAAGRWVPLEATLPAGYPSWSSDGRRVLAACVADGKPWVCAAAADCPLAGVRDVVSYPELYDRGLSPGLVRNRFVARPSADKEFFQMYEQVRYQGRGILVTPDTVLQAFSDVFARLLQAQEQVMAGWLRDICLASATWAVEQHEKLPADEGYRRLAILFAVPAALLDCAVAVWPGGLEPDLGMEPEEGGQDAKAAAAEMCRSRAERVRALFPQWLKAEVDKGLALLAGAQMVPLAKGELGVGRDMTVDFTMAVPRGNYTAFGMRQYFQALMWLRLMPVALDEAAVEYARWLPAAEAPADDGEHAAPGGNPQEAGADADAAEVQAAVRPLDALNRVDAFLASVAGPPALHGLMLLVSTVAAAKGETEPREIWKLMDKAFGPVKVRTLGDAVGEEPAAEFYVLPGRLSPDAEVLKSVTHPDVDRRGIPTALDFLAALGVKLAADLVTVPEGELWSLEEWAARIAAWREEWTRRGQEYFRAGTYVRWVGLLRVLADGYAAAAGGPEFARSDPYRGRLLMSSLAGFAQLKHATVLYSFANYGVECDMSSPIVLLYERPVKPRAAVFVEPHVVFYRALAATCAEAGKAFGVPVAPLRPLPGECSGAPFHLDCMEAQFARDDDPGCPGFCVLPDSPRRSALQVLAWIAETLAEISEKELRGEPLSADEHGFLLYFGATLEALFLNQHKWDTGANGADQGRQERGMTLVTDIYTNVQRGLVLHEAVGLPLSLYAVVPFDRTVRIVQGGMLSWYEFTNPNRLTDEEWWAWIKDQSGDLSASLPGWAASFMDH